MSWTDLTEKEAALRDSAERDAQNEDARVAYYASWLVFYIDQHRSAMAAWQASVDRLMPK